MSDVIELSSVVIGEAKYSLNNCDTICGRDCEYDRCDVRNE